MSGSIVFLGPPASGKGTQGRRLAEDLGLAYLSTGALLRREVRDGSSLGGRAKTYLDSGEYVPDEVMVPMVLEWVSRQASDWLLDGFPRTLRQAMVLDDELDVEVRAIILEVGEAELRRRVSGRLECVDCHRVAKAGEKELCVACGGRLVPREDDSVESFENRLAEYQRLVLPAIDYYRERERAVLVDGLAPPDVVYDRVLKAVAVDVVI